MERNETDGEMYYVKQIKRLLTQKGIAYSSRKIPYRHLCVFDIVNFADLPEGLEQRITVYVYEKTIRIHAEAPVLSIDKDATALLINALNIENKIGVFRYDVVSGEMKWSYCFHDCHGKWPGDMHILAVLHIARNMTKKLYSSLLDMEGYFNCTNWMENGYV